MSTVKKDLKVLREVVSLDVNYSEEARVGKVFVPIYKDSDGTEYVILSKERALIMSMNVVVSRLVANGDKEKLENVVDCGLSNMATRKDGNYEFGYFVAEKGERVIIELS